MSLEDQYHRTPLLILFAILFIIVSCNDAKTNPPLGVVFDPDLRYEVYVPNATDRTISRADYADKLYGFWLGECIANWTGLITEMDKINFQYRYRFYPPANTFKGTISRHV